MGHPKGRHLAGAATCAGIVVLGTAAYVGRDRIVEEWWIHRLGSTDSSERVRAARKLAEMKSLRAVPHLVRAIREDPEEGVQHTGVMTATLGGEPGPLDVETVLLSPLAYELHRIGPEAAERLRREAGDHADEPRVTLVIDAILKSWREATSVFSTEVFFDPSIQPRQFRRPRIERPSPLPKDP